MSFFGLSKAGGDRRAARQDQEGAGKVKRSISYFTDVGFGCYLGKKQECMVVAEASASDTFRAWRQVAIASGRINQPWHYKLMQIRKELYR
ncbi:hypothetical protein [Paenibacillus ihumii]|uniref:hypothetical protein n=1 Tax=Paenibacillus ihumii TaxID=687436 RepID=UPI001CA32F11|nr:hypothetical protein [Paenibacillus ihumii]